MEWNEWYDSVEATVDAYVGLSDLSQLNRTRKLKAKKIVKHEAFDDSSLINDLAIIQLQDRIETSNRIQFVCLPHTQSIFYPDPLKEVSELYSSETEKILDVPLMECWHF